MDSTESVRAFAAKMRGRPCPPHQQCWVSCLSPRRHRETNLISASFSPWRCYLAPSLCGRCRRHQQRQPRTRIERRSGSSAAAAAHRQRRIELAPPRRPRRSVAPRKLASRRRLECVRPIEARSDAVLDARARVSALAHDCGRASRDRVDTDAPEALGSKGCTASRALAHLARALQDAVLGGQHHPHRRLEPQAPPAGVGRAVAMEARLGGGPLLCESPPRRLCVGGES